MSECVTHHHACDCREARFAELEAEYKALRAIFPEILAALDNGSFCTGNNSLEFLKSIPDEVKMHVARLNREALRGGEGAA